MKAGVRKEGRKRQMHRIGCVLFFAALLCFLTGCGKMPGGSASEAGSGAIKYGREAVFSSAAGEIQTAGEMTVPAEEARLVICTSHKREVWWPIVKEFEERTGIWVTVSEAGTSEILTRIAEARGNPQADVIFGGGAETLEAFRDYFVSYRAAGREEVQPAFSGGEENLWTPFSALPLVLVYNTKLVEPEKVQAWADVMRPEFRGQIAFADPARSGSGFTALVTLRK